MSMHPVLAHLGEELSIALLAAEETNNQNPGPVDGEQSTGAVEFACEDLQHDQGEGELRQRRAHIGSLEGPLGRSHLDDFVRRQGHRASPVHSKTIPIRRAALEMVRDPRECGRVIERGGD